MLCCPSWAMAVDKWSVLAYTLTVIDGLQTYEAANNDDFYERNFILGKYPENWEVIAYFGAVLGMEWLCFNKLSEPWKRFTQGFFIGVEGKTIYTNYQVGVRISLPFGR